MSAPTHQPAPTTHTYFSQRLRLQYLDWGNDSAPHMLLIHGIRDHGRTWDRLAQEFRSDFHIVVPDLRGHGDSEWTRGSSYSLLEYVCDIEQLVRQRRLDDVVIVSHSMGGTIAALFAGLYPERVSRLVMIEPIGLYPSPLADDPRALLRSWINSNREMAGRIPRRYPSVEEAFGRMQTANPHLTPELAKFLTIHGSNQNEDGTYSWKFDNHTRAGTPYDIPDQDMIALWKQITCPVLIINSKDGYPHRIGQDDTLKHFQDIQLIDVDNAGHWTHHDQLEEVMSAMRSYL